MSSDRSGIDRLLIAINVGHTIEVSSVAANGEPRVLRGELTMSPGARLGVISRNREGADVAILATGIFVHNAILAAGMLEARGIGARVLDLHTIKPLDEKAVVSAAQETGALVTVEDGNILGGLGGAVAELISEKCPVQTKRIGVRAVFGESGTAEEIKARCGLTPAAIQNAVQEAVKAKAEGVPAKKGRTPDIRRGHGGHRRQL